MKFAQGITFFLLLVSFVLLSPSRAAAYTYFGKEVDCISGNYLKNASVTSPFTEGSGRLEIKLDNFTLAGNYSIKIRRISGTLNVDFSNYTSPEQLIAGGASGDFSINDVSDETLSTIDFNGGIQNAKAIRSEHSVDVYNNGSYLCSLTTKRLMVDPMKISCAGPVLITQQRNGQACTFAPSDLQSCIQKNTNVDFSIPGWTDTYGSPLNGKVRVFFNTEAGIDEEPTVSGGTATFSHSFSQTGTYSTNFNYDAGDQDGIVRVQGCNGFKFTIKEVCGANECSQATESYPVIDINNIVPPELQFQLCKQASNAIPSNSSGLSQQAECNKCLQDDGSGYSGIWTAVGCIRTEPRAIVQTVVRIGIGIGGGLALLMTLVGGFILTTSEGDPKRKQEGQEMITSSVIGIIFVLFSVVILQFIGVTILRLPGFGT